VATDMQDDLRKMIERLLNQKRPENRKVVLLSANPDKLVLMLVRSLTP
jgi:hypothetical protein